MLQVEGCLFRVPRLYFERESEFFRTTFQLPPPARSRIRDGDSDERPLRLDQVKKADFRALLSIIYPSFQTLPTAFTTDQWISILELSTMWAFDKIRKLSIENLEPKVLDPIQQLTLAQEHAIKSWTLPAVMKLVKRDEAIRLEEGMKIGIETTLKIASIRECRCLNELTGGWTVKERQGEGPTPGEISLEDKIKQVFAL
ncbi:hypothetical protein BDN72DRAFT_759432 [Pluteus cervinus]|uniref:Uncharacterized protein n=1 Tax=Pluteus cervinus TaxID=181527 RepID=A0ACD3BAJ9_9AGAR|nr:hypothetical protein BDN72DRAFT_759432 [Pluteus cervinus]